MEQKIKLRRLIVIKDIDSFQVRNRDNMNIMERGSLH